MDAYLAQGHRVAVIDDLASGRRENLNPDARFYEADIGGPEVEEIFAQERPQIVSHHAGQIDVRTSVSDPEQNIRDNIVGLVRLASASVRQGVEMFIFSSTGGAICGEPEGNPVPESAPARPLSPYCIDKRVGGAQNGAGASMATAPRGERSAVSMQGNEKLTASGEDESDS